MYYGYKIHGNYRSLTVWAFDEKTHQLVHTFTSRLLPGLSLENRKAHIEHSLSTYKIKPPVAIAK